MATPPDGPHTPLTNVVSEAAPVTQEDFEDPFPGEAGDAQPVTDDGREDVPRTPKIESLAFGTSRHLAFTGCRRGVVRTAPPYRRDCTWSG